MIWVAVVNDASVHSVRLFQETVTQTMQEKKLHKMLLVKSKLFKPTNQIKKAYREASTQLTPTEQIDLIFELKSFGEETEVSSNLKMDSSFNLVDDDDVVDAVM